MIKFSIKSYEGINLKKKSIINENTAFHLAFRLLLMNRAYSLRSYKKSRNRQMRKRPSQTAINAPKMLNAIIVISTGGGHERAKRTCSRSPSSLKPYTKYVMHPFVLSSTEHFFSDDPGGSKFPSSSLIIEQFFNWHSSGQFWEIV